MWLAAIALLALQNGVVREAVEALQRNESARAVEIATPALATEDRADLRNLRGKAHEALGDTASAITDLQQAIHLNRYEESYYFDLGNVLLRHQNFDAAISLLEASKRVFARSAQLELMLGVAYYGQRRFSDAVGAFLRTAAIAPDVEQPHVFLGRILTHTGDRLPDVVDRFGAYARRHPDSPTAHFLYGKALAMRPESQASAERHLRRSIELDAKHWESHFELALLLEARRDWAGAAAGFERAIELNPADPAPHYRLARAYDRLGRGADASRERALHEKLIADEKAAIEKHKAGVRRLDLVVK